MNDTAPAPTSPADPVMPDPSQATAPAGPLRANISKGYRFRLALIGLGLTGFGLWSLYDGFVAYPKKQKVWQQLEAFREDHDDWQTSWPDYAREHGHPTNYNEIKELEDFDIVTQYIMAGICLPIGGWFLLNWVRAGGRWVEADDRGVRTNKGDDIAWGQVQGIDDQRWKSKGIAYLRYDKGGASGAESRVLLDDWKFEREPTDAIYKLAKGRLQPEEGVKPPMDTDEAR